MSDHLLWRLRNNDTAKHLCGLAADEIERLRDALAARRRLDEREWGAWKAGCPVCGLGSDGKPMAYACARNDCPTRATCT